MSRNPYKNQSLEKLRERAAKIKEAIAAKEARAKDEARRRETRGKIVLGGLALRHLPGDQLAALAAHAAERDRAALAAVMPPAPPNNHEQPDA